MKQRYSNFLGLFLGLCLLIGVVIGCATPAFALKIAPFKVSVTSDKAIPTQLFRIENNSAEPAAVQISVMSWHIAPDGTEFNEDAEDDFIVFPAQLVLKPYESKSVRVQWLGKDKQTAPNSVTEKAYRVIAEQIPVNLKDTPQSGSAVRFLLRFKAALYLTPPNAKSDVVVQGVQVYPDSLRVTLANRGTRHTLLNKPALHLTLKNGEEMTVSGESLKPLEGENIHANSSRFFDLRFPQGLPSPIVSARLDFESGF